MKSALTLITIALLLTAATLFAQTEGRKLMRVNIASPSKPKTASFRQATTASLR
jgi:hypothetical protein